MAAAPCTTRSLVQTLARHVEVEVSPGLCRGRTVVDMRRRTVLPEPNAHVAVEVDVAGFVDLLLTRLAKLPAGQPV